MTTYTYMVVKVPEADARTLLYAPKGTTITITEDQDIAWLDVGDLNNLNLWPDALALAEQQRAPKPQQCTSRRCLRAEGHPSHAEDGVGHSVSARYQGL